MLFKCQLINHNPFVQDNSLVRGGSVGGINPDKLDLMSENSSLKVKLAMAEKTMKDKDDLLGSAQVR
jgi:hypothetical protein